MRFARLVAAFFAIPLVSAGPAVAASASSAVVAEWSYTIRGTLVRQWTVQSAEPCAYAGDGDSHFRLSSDRRTSVLIVRSPYTGRLTEPDYVLPALRIRGRWTDRRVANPPPVDQPDQCTTGEPVEPRGCPPLNDLYSLQMITDPERTPGRAVLRVGIDQVDQPCGPAPFLGLTNGRRNPVLIGHPTLRQFLRARGPLTFVATDRVPRSGATASGPYRETMDRRVIMRFVRIR